MKRREFIAGSAAIIAAPSVAKAGWLPFAGAGGYVPPPTPDPTWIHPPDTTLFSYTGLASGAAQTTTYNADRGLSFARTDTGGAATERVSFKGKTVPVGSSWTATARLMIGPTIIGGYFRMGIGIHNSSSLRTIMLGQNTQARSAGIEFNWIYFSNMNTWSTGGGTGVLTNQELPSWYRITWNGTSYLLYLSYDEGITYTLINTMAAASYFTATHVGIVINTYTTFGALSRPTCSVMYWDDPDFPA